MHSEHTDTIYSNTRQNIPEVFPLTIQTHLMKLVMSEELEMAEAWSPRRRGRGKKCMYFNIF